MSIIIIITVLLSFYCSCFILNVLLSRGNLNQEAVNKKEAYIFFLHAIYFDLNCVFEFDTPALSCRFLPACLVSGNVLAGLLFHLALEWKLLRRLALLNRMQCLHCTYSKVQSNKKHEKTKVGKQELGNAAKVLFTKASTSNTSTPTAKMWVQFSVLGCRTREKNPLQPPSDSAEKNSPVFTPSIDCPDHY